MLIGYRDVDLARGMCHILAPYSRDRSEGTRQRENEKELARGEEEKGKSGARRDNSASFALRARILANALTMYARNALEYGSRGHARKSATR